MFNHRAPGRGGQPAVSAALLKQTRASGQLNLSGRNLGVIPDAVWRVNVDAGVGQVADLSGSDDAWWDQQDLTKLFIASNGLTEIGDGVEHLPALVTLDAHDNAIAAVSPRIACLSELRTCNLAHNRLAALPDAICELPALQVLRLEHNAIARLPAAFGALTSLVELDVSNNALDALPDTIGRLAQLRRLVVAGNRLRRLPASFGRLGDSLEELDASGNAIEVEPGVESFSLLRALVRVDLRHNALRRVPDLSRCAALRELLLGHNRIAALGDMRSVPPCVRVLDLRDNQLSEVPASAGGVVDLERLDLTNNDLSGLPPELGTLPALKSIVLDGNPMRSIRRDIINRGTVAIKDHLRKKLAADPDEAAHAAHASQQSERAAAADLRASKALVYSGKDAAVVPSEVWAEAAEAGVGVESIVLSENRLTELPWDVTAFAATLTTLDVRKNRLRALAGEAVGRLRALRVLDVRFNLLDDLPPEIARCSTLEEALLAGNAFAEIPRALHRVGSLTAIVAHDCRIASIDAGAICGLERLACLDLHNNAIAAVPPELGRHPSLKKLELHGNTFRTPRPAVLAKGTPAVLEWLRNRIA